MMQAQGHADSGGPFIEQPPQDDHPPKIPSAQGVSTVSRPTTIQVEDLKRYIPSGSRLIFGGAVVNNRPMTAVRELLRVGAHDFEVIAMAGGLETELLLRTGAISHLVLSHLSLGPFGVAPSLRLYAADDRTRITEVSGHVLVTGLDAAARGLPFLPVAGDPDLPWIGGATDFCVRSQCPFTGADYLAARNLTPDVAVIHAEGLDDHGNAQLATSVCADLMLAAAARSTIVTYERTEPLRVDANHLLPAVLIDYVCHAPFGAFPTAFAPRYDLDVDWFDLYLAEAAGPDRALSRIRNTNEIEYLKVHGHSS